MDLFLWFALGIEHCGVLRVVFLLGVLGGLSLHVCLYHTGLHRDTIEGWHKVGWFVGGFRGWGRMLGWLLICVWDTDTECSRIELLFVLQVPLPGYT